jgi:hypothetical protein
MKQPAGQTGGRVKTPGVVTAEDPATGEPDPTELKEGMEKASRGDDSAARRLESEDEMKRRAAREDQRENDAGA